MNPEIPKVGVSAQKERIEAVVAGSFLLLPESKAALLSRLEVATDAEETSRIVAFLESERKFILEFMKRRLWDDDFPEKASALLWEMRSWFLRELRERENLENSRECPVERQLESGLSLAFV